MIKIVDARMGLGKTSAAIQYMNDHPDAHYLFITPFIDETERIRDNCAELNFCTPSNRLGSYDFKKSDHLRALVGEGKNIAMTHALFTGCDDSLVKLIAESNYIVFIDEVIDVLQPLAISSSDIDILIASGWLVGSGRGESTDYEYYEAAADKRYQGGRFSELFRLAKGHRLVNLGEETDRQNFYFWSLHKELFTLSNEIYVLTYIFDGMPMKALLDINGIKYTYIGVAKDECGRYRFTDTPEEDYDPSIREKIHICINDNLNEIGDHRTALSATWTKNAVDRPGTGKIDQLRRSIDTFFRNYVPDGIGSKDRLWCVYKDARSSVSGKGYTKRYEVWTSRATNKFKNCKALAYCVNVFFSPHIHRYFETNGVRIDADRYALANMVQWLWRGAIRDGEEMWVYVPSRRMRNLLTDWLNKLAGEVVDDDAKRAMRELYLRRSLRVRSPM